jgi:orotidine-5'-phosphate decarboxylase
VTFLEKYLKARAAKNSILCVGLDLAMQSAVEGEMGDYVLDFCLDIVDKTADYACAFKPNSQFILFALGMERLKKLNARIHERGCISILDHKLGDIGSSNLSALFWIKEVGFDAFTYSPFAGNIQDITMHARHHDLGVFVLTLMSNPESVWVQKEAKIDGVPLYLAIARKVAESKPSGVVVGTTGHITEDDIKAIRDTVPKDTIFLCPGVGEQGGDPEKIIRIIDGGNILINVSRAIVNTTNQTDKAKEYRDQFNKYRQ